MASQPSQVLHSFLEDPEGTVLGGFQGGYERQGAPSDLHDFKQLSGETLRKFIQRFTQKMNTIPCIKQELVIASFHANVHNTRMCEKLSNRRVESTCEL